MFDTNTPGTGPEGHEAGASRRPNHEELQRSVYNGWKKIHGIKILSVVMANGLQIMHGPISARQNDIASVHMSGLDDYLLDLQHGQEIIYRVFGDGIFKLIARPQSAIRSYHEGAPLAPLTELEVHENCVIRKMRVFVEHTYAQVANKFHIVNVAREWKMMNISSHHPEKLRLIFFLSNCLTCIHGDGLSKSCECPPPVLEEFLFG